MRAQRDTRRPATLHVPRRMVVVCLVALVVAACGGAPRFTHEEEIANWRAEKDQFMRESPDSPVPGPERATFAPLVYFPISEAYNVPAALTPVQTDDFIEMSTSGGQRRRMRRVGTLGFTVQAQQLALTAYVDASANDMRRLFVPFGDLTNGGETYAGGRYLDLERTVTGIYELDFNRAYNPFCVFNVAYDCPLPPRENRLGVPIRAGEKLPADY